MTAKNAPDPAEHYLRTLDDELAGAPDATRSAIVADVRAHIADALDEGRTLTDVLAGLGSAREVAAQSRAELAFARPTDTTSVKHSDSGARAAFVLHPVGVVLGVVTAVFVTLLLPSIASVSSTSGGGVVTNPTATLAQEYGLWVVAVALLPALMAALPLLVHDRARGPIALANAIVVTAFTVVGGFTVGGFYVPLAFLMWAAVIVPWRLRRGLNLQAAPGWRIAGAMLVAAPALLATYAAVTGTLVGGWMGGAAIVVAIALAVLFGIGFRLAYAAIALLGAGLLVLTLIDPRAFLLGLWWFGGAYLALGLAALVATRTPRGDPV